MSQFYTSKTGRKTQPNHKISVFMISHKQKKQRHEQAEPQKKIQKSQFKIEKKLVLTNFVHLQVSE